MFRPGYIYWICQFRSYELAGLAILRLPWPGRCLSGGGVDRGGVVAAAAGETPQPVTDLVQKENGPRRA